jgi:amino acid transporter
MNTMLFLAVNTIDKLKAVPPKFWWMFMGFILGFFVVVWLLKRLLRVNKVFLFLGVFVVSMFTFVSWVYNRNEPAFLTPFVDQLAQFLPTKNAYAESEHRAVIPDNTQKTPPTPPPPPRSNVY